MKRFLKTAAATGVPFGLMMGLYHSSQHGSREGMWMGAVAGVLFGILIAFFQTRVAKRFDQVRVDYQSEGLLHDSAANLGRGFAKTGGWLFLTKQRLVFEPHKVNVNTRRVEITLGDIVESRAPKGLFASRLELVTKQGDTFRFIVQERDLWLAMLSQAARQFTAASTGS